MVRNLLIGQSILMLGIVLAMLLTLVVRKFIVDRRNRLAEKRRLAVRDAVFDFVSSDGEHTAKLWKLIPRAKGALRDQRVDDIAHSLLEFTVKLTGEVKEQTREFLREVGYTKHCALALLQGTTRERAEAAQMLGDIGEYLYADHLARALEDPDEAVRVCAARALGKVRSSSATLPLVEAVSDDAVAAGIVAHSLVQFRGEVEEDLTETLDHDDNEVRRISADVLGELRMPGPRHKLGGLAQADEYSDVRAACARALGKIEWPDSEEPLLALIEDENADVRRAAVHALVKLQSPETVPILVRFLSDPDHLVAREAALGLHEYSEMRKGTGERIAVGEAAHRILEGMSLLGIRASDYAREVLADEAPKQALPRGEVVDLAEARGSSTARAEAAATD